MINTYRCPLCHKEVERNSNLYWIRTYCDTVGQFTRFKKITK